MDKCRTLVVKRAALFRFHTIHNPQDIIARVRFFKLLNPDVAVYGLFGGSVYEYKKITSALHQAFLGLTFWDEPDREIKWRSSDLAYQTWYNQVGYQEEFDALYPIEWDLILMDSLENLFSHIPRTALGCTGLISLKYIENSWYWSADEKIKKEWHTFYNSVASSSQIAYSGAS